MHVRARFNPNELTLKGCRILLIFSIMLEDAAPQPTLNAANPYAFENVLVTMMFLKNLTIFLMELFHLQVNIPHMLDQ